jgi:glyoxylase-like metal-dependent hydrolase (beta-lactamase superfamily II)
MKITRLMTGMVDSNAYILADSGEAALIDAGVHPDEIMDVISAEGLKLKYIILTHAHFDHVLYIDKLRDITGAKVLIHEKDAKALTHAQLNGSLMFGGNYVFKPADVILKEGDIIEVGAVRIEVIHTPGHTSGGICLKADNTVFTGDTLFRLSVGRSDLGDGDGRLLIKSIKEKLMVLEDDIVVYPGHGESSTIGFERQKNYFL